MPKILTVLAILFTFNAMAIDLNEKAEEVKWHLWNAGVHTKMPLLEEEMFMDEDFFDETREVSSSSESTVEDAMFYASEELMFAMEQTL